MVNLAITSTSNLQLICIYRPPIQSCSLFGDEFYDLIHSLDSTNYLILGDFNYHFGSIETYHAEFTNLIYTLALSQHVSSPTHIKNNILDLVITPPYPSFTITHPTISNLITDHYAIQFTLDIEMTLPKREVLRYYRKLSAIDYELFQSDFLATISSEPLTAEFLNNSLISILNIHAPISKITIIPRPKSPWFNLTLSSIKRSYRNAEKKYNANKSLNNYTYFINLRKFYKHSISKAKQIYYRNKIVNLSGNSRSLYRLTDTLLGRQKINNYPDIPINILCNKFVKHFSDKSINTCNIIHNKLSQYSNFQISFSTNSYDTINTSLNSFCLPTTVEIYNHIIKTKSSSKNDPLPLSSMKNILNTIYLFIHQIICDSITSNTFPQCYKKSMIIPILKKPTLDTSVLLNYRPISQLPIISKVLERIICKQITEYLVTNNLYDPNQSAFRPSHSTETALNMVTDSILKSLDENHVAQLLLLDLTSAFDTILHKNLFVRLAEIGISNNALAFIKSYLEDRYYSVVIDECESELVSMTHGFPQGSVLGPLLFLIYISPLKYIIKSFPNIQYFIYADDIQLLSKIPYHYQSSINNELSLCADSINVWLLRNNLLLNTNKTELINISISPNRFPIVNVDNIQINSKSKVKNLGVIFDEKLSFIPQINSLSKSANLSLYKIKSIRKLITHKTCEILINSLVFHA